jgi:FkbM family methyltransferase
MTASAAAERAMDRLLRVLLKLLLLPRDGGATVRLGTAYGGWIVPRSLLRPGAVCYLAGVGEDASFDVCLIEAGCQVVSIDPTPRAIAYAETVRSREPRFALVPFGIWESDTSMRFYAPEDPAHVSHSITNLQQSNSYFTAECRSVASLMSELGHSHLDLLKLDIEGAEYAVLASLRRDGISPAVICIEFHQPPFLAILREVRSWQRRGYAVRAVEGWNVTLASGRS